MFQTILSLIQHHPVFTNHSNVAQAPVEVQLAVTLYCMGQYGNGAFIQDIGRVAGCSEGSVENYTAHCFDAIESLQQIFVHKLTPEEKEWERQWIDEHLGFKGAWRDGWLMYDETIVVLYQQPGLNRDAYYTWMISMARYISLDTILSFLALFFYEQIGHVPSNLCVVDFSHGHTGSCHGTHAFEGTAVVMVVTSC